MPDSARFALHRPEHLPALERGDRKIAELLAGSDRRLAAGSELVAAGAEHSYVYRLVSGWVGRVRALSDGRAQYILVFLPPDLFAVKSMFVRAHSDAVMALTDCVIQQIDHRALASAYASDPDISLRCTWQVIEEERRLHNWVVGLGQGASDERVAMMLIEFYERLRLSDGLASGEMAFHLPLTQSQIGDLMGVTPIHVNRVLRTLRERDVVTVRDKRCVIHDLDALYRLAEPLLDMSDRDPRSGQLAPRV